MLFAVLGAPRVPGCWLQAAGCRLCPASRCGCWYWRPGGAHAARLMASAMVARARQAGAHTLAPTQPRCCLPCFPHRSGAPEEGAGIQDGCHWHRSACSCAHLHSPAGTSAPSLVPPQLAHARAAPPALSPPLQASSRPLRRLWLTGPWLRLEAACLATCTSELGSGFGSGSGSGSGCVLGYGCRRCCWCSRHAQLAFLPPLLAPLASLACLPTSPGTPSARRAGPACALFGASSPSPSSTPASSMLVSGVPAWHSSWCSSPQAHAPRGPAHPTPRSLTLRPPSRSSLQCATWTGR